MLTAKFMDSSREMPMWTGGFWDHGRFTGFYEKVIKVKADVAAVLVSAMQRFGSGGGHCQGRRFLAFILTLDSVHHHSDTRVGNEAEHVLCSASFHIGVTFLVPIPRRGVRFPSLL
jgi:hypothetical protein